MIRSSLTFFFADVKSNKYLEAEVSHFLQAFQIGRDQFKPFHFLAELELGSSSSLEVLL